MTGTSKAAIERERHVAKLLARRELALALGFARRHRVRIDRSRCRIYDDRGGTWRAFVQLRELP